MEEVYNIKDLPEDVQERLQQVTSFSPKRMTSEDQRFLRARRAYLRPEQQEVFAGVLDGTIPPIDVEEEEEEEEIVATPDREAEEEEEVRQIDPNNYRKDQLIQMARDAGVLPDGDPTKADIAAALNEYFKSQ